MADNVDYQAFQDKIAAMEQQQSGMDTGLKSGGPGGTSNGMDNGRLDKIETRLTVIEGEQRTHFRWGIGLLVTVAFGLAALIATTSMFMMSRIDRTEDRLVRVEAAIAELPNKLSTNLNNMNHTLLQAVTAGKQLPPQIIVLPTPQQSGSVLPDKP